MDVVYLLVGIVIGAAAMFCLAAVWVLSAMGDF